MATDDDAPTSYIKLTISPDPGLELILDAMTAEEELGRPFLITVDVSCKTAQSDLYTHLGASVTVTLTPQEGDARYFNGILARFAFTGFGGGAFRYRLELRPWIWLLSQVQDCKIFQAKSAWDIIMAVFQAAGFSDYADKRQNSAGSAVLTYCVQYRETSLDFVTRLMEEYGIYYFVTHTDGSHVINLADDPNSHVSVGAAIPYRACRSPTGGRSTTTSGTGRAMPASGPAPTRCGTTTSPRRPPTSRRNPRCRGATPMGPARCTTIPASTRR